MTVGLTLVRYSTMPTEVITAIISGIVALMCAILTFITTNKKTKIEQLKRLEDYNERQREQIQEFREDTRDEISKLQDSFAEHKVDIQASINELRAAQQQTQAVITLRLDSLEKKQERHNDLIERVYEIEKHMAIIEEKEKINS